MAVVAESAKGSMIGRRAPDFTVVDHAGQTVTLNQFRGKSAVVLFFYPMDNSPSCTREACTFRDQYSEFKTSGGEIIGINGAAGESHRGFAEKRNLPFRLVTDTDGAVRKSFGVPSFLGLVNRVTFVIDKEGIIRHVTQGLRGSRRHVSEALAAVKKLGG